MHTRTIIHNMLSIVKRWFRTPSILSVHQLFRLCRQLRHYYILKQQILAHFSELLSQFISWDDLFA